MHENDVEVQQGEELAIRTGIQAGDGQMGSGGATPGSPTGTGSAVGSQIFGSGT
jgi:hypothetical protein